MKKHLPALVYLLGFAPLGIWQNSLRVALGDWLSFVAVVGYLLVLRLIGYLAVELFDFQKRRQIAKFNLSVEKRKQQKPLGKT
ncbi:MAG: hypothetical protein V4772_21575 [Pseudomonadota bacterium]